MSWSVLCLTTGPSLSVSQSCSISRAVMFCLVTRSQFRNTRPSLCPFSCINILGWSLFKDGCHVVLLQYRVNTNNVFNLASGMSFKLKKSWKGLAGSLLGVHLAKINVCQIWRERNSRNIKSLMPVTMPGCLDRYASPCGVWYTLRVPRD